MRPYLLFILACVCTLTGAFAARADPEPPPESPPQPQPSTRAAPPEPDLAGRQLARLIDRYRRRVWHWQRVMGHPITRRLEHPPRRLAGHVSVWRRVAKRTWARAKNPPHKSAWLCIHRLEAAWNDPSPPYYGGLQMDLGFQQRYAFYLLRSKGTANRWSPLEQMWVAERAFRSGRGFYPWPNTAHSCGLL
jgi:hypothetical protein